MLSNKVRKYLVDAGVFDETRDESYEQVMSDLGIRLDSAFAEFNLYTNAITFSGKYSEIYNVCWFAINSTYSDEGEGGFFYNRLTGEVLELELGQKLIDFQCGRLQSQWKDFKCFPGMVFRVRILKNPVDKHKRILKQRESSSFFTGKDW